MKKYSPSELLRNVFYFAHTKIRFSRARLIRFPIDIRGPRKGLRYGSGFTTGTHCRFDLGQSAGALTFGNNCKLNDRVHIVALSSVSIGSDTLVASNVFISDTSHGWYKGEIQDSPLTPPDARPLHTTHVSIGARVWIGEGVSIMPGSTIGDGTIIGANAVVTGDFPSNVQLAGVPARVIKEWDEQKQRWERVK